MRTFIRFGLASVAMLAAGLSKGYANDDLMVSEVMPCNISTYMVDFNYTGWLELQNNANSSIDLNGYKIDHYKYNKSNELKFEWSWFIQKEMIISKNSFKVICFDGSDMDSKTARKLDSNGGAIVIKDKSGELVDSFVYKATQTHISYGVYNGVAGYMEPTPEKNNTVSYETLSSRCVMPYFDGLQPGVVNGGSTIKIKTKTSGATIYYTTDGSEPTNMSKVYNENNGIAIESSNRIIRARAYKDGMISSPILTGSFILVDNEHKGCGANGFTLPIVSIVTDNANFYDGKTGIYTKGDGTNGAWPENDCLQHENQKLNYIMDWTRPGNFEYIVDNKVVLSNEVDLAVMGGCSRQYEVKSLKIKAGNRMGKGNTKLNYDFFADKMGNEYKSLQLRNGGNGYSSQYVRWRDGFMQSIAKPMNIDRQAYQPVAYYINGKYAGLMGLRERTNKAFVESNYGLDDDKLDVIEITTTNGVVATCGDRKAYDEMVDFLENNNPESADYYEKASKMMDMDEYIDYQIFEQFIVNTDWPGNNSKLWRSRNNGRFRWVTFDTDFGFGLYGEGNGNNCTVNNNMIKWACGKERTNWANREPEQTTIFRHLIQNPTFKERFVTKYLLHLSSTFKYENIQAKYDSIVKLVEKEYCATYNESVDNSAAARMLSFAKGRPSVIYKNLAELTSYEDYVTLNVSSSTSRAHILMNDELMPSATMSTQYFKGKQVKLEAIAPAGYKFIGWKDGNETSSSNTVVANTSIDTTNLTYTHGRVWKYYTSEAGLENDWRYADFDDSKWLSGSGKMGYHDKGSYAYDTDIKSGEAGKHYATVYFRSTFNVEDLSEIEALVARITYDDGFAIYVNGTRIQAENLSVFTGDAYIGQWANNEVARVVIPKSSLKQGANQLAVEVHQHEAASSDLTFYFEESIVEAAKAPTTVTPEGYISANPILVTTVKSNLKVKAVFEKVGCDIPDLFINEICSSNNANGGTPDEFGNYPDWFEVYNASSDTVNLAGMYLTDKAGKPTKYMIPYGYAETKVAPKGRLVFWADGMPYLGPLHTSFKLENVDNAYLGLNSVCSDDVNAVDGVNYMELASNKSYGHDEDGSGNWIVFGDCDNGKVYLPTPGKANSSNICSSNECTLTDVEDEELTEELLPVLAVYPIPTKDVVNVMVKNAESMNIFIYDNIGRLLEVHEGMNAAVTLNLEAYGAGVYHLEVIANGEVFRQTIIKE